MVIGAVFEDENGQSSSGKAYIFSATPQTYLDRITKLIP
jgi:hypothetical protein